MMGENGPRPRVLAAAAAVGVLGILLIRRRH
jgi:MYXO-CTERM domain-containing protein